MSAALDLHPAFADVLRRLRRRLWTDDPLLSPGARIVDSARRLAAAEDVRERLHPAAAFRSLDPRITGDHRGVPKAHAFVGDALFAVGFQAPTAARTRDGEDRIDVEYADPGVWPSHDGCFGRVTPERLEPGDLVVVTPAVRARCAHVEVVTATAPFTSLGVRAGVVVEDERHQRLLAAITGWTPDGWGRAPGVGNLAIALLRPRR